MLLALSGTVALKAQTQKGDQTLGGGISLITSKNTVEYTGTINNGNYSYSNKSTSFSIGPNYSFFVANNLDLGGSIAYSYQNSKFTNLGTASYNPDKANSQSFSGAVYLRKYFLYDNKIGIRTGPFASVTHTKATLTYSATANMPDYGPQTDTNVSAGVGLDLVYFPYKKLGLTASLGSLGYNHDDTKQPQSGLNTSSNSFGFSFFSGVDLTAFFVFGK